MKKRISMLLCLLIAVVLVSFALHTANADDNSGQCGDDLYWELDKSTGTLTISGTGDMWDFNTALSTYWYDSREAILSLVLENGMTSIGEEAFVDLHKITSVIIPDTVTQIGDRAFYNCDSLSKVMLSNSVTQIGESAFEDCTELDIVYYRGTEEDREDMDIGDNNESFTDVWWVYMQSETSGQCGEDLYWSFDTSTGTLAITGSGEMEDVFWDDYRAWIQHVILPQGLTTIKEYAFCDCEELTEITIPDSVTSIGYSAFYNCTGLTSISIPDSVTSLGEETFGYCTGLTSVEFGDGITRIEYGMFQDCGNLATITIGSNVVYIDWNAFLDTAWWNKQSNGLVYLDYVLLGNKGTISSYSLTIKSGTRVIANGALSDCTKPRSISLPDTLTHIGNYAFSSCTALTSIVIPDGVTNLGEGAFNDCSALKTVTIPCSVNPEWYPFSGCDEISKIYITKGTGEWTESGYMPWSYRENAFSVEISDGISTIPESAFYNCTGLTSIAIPEGVTDIGQNAFNYCTGLTEVTIPNSVESIGESAFVGCESLSAVTLGNGLSSIADSVFRECRSLSAITIPDSVISIGDSAFSNCENLAAVTFGSGVAAIDNYAFYGCSSLTQVVIPSGVTEISEGVLYGCEALSSVTIPDNVTSIGDSAFNGCTSLTEITIPDSVARIEGRAFWECTNLASVTLPCSAEIPWWDNAFSGCEAIAEIHVTKGTGEWENAGNMPWFYGSDSIAVTLEEGVETIPESAFNGCEKLTSITIPDSVTSIGGWALCGCTNLATVSVGNGVTQVGESILSDTAWWNARSNGLVYLDYILLGYKGSCPISVSVKNGTRVIADNAFSECDRPKSVVIPDSVICLGHYAFASCGNLTTVTMPCSAICCDAFSWCYDISSIHITKGTGIWPVYEEDYSPFNSSGYNDLTVTLDEGIQNIGSYAFASCRGLKTITIPDSVTSIGLYAFSNTGLTAVTIPNGVTEIRKGGFQSTGLTSAELGSGLISIGEQAFADCGDLEEITIPDNVTSIGQSAFMDTGLITVKIGSGISSIESFTFSGCWNLCKLTVTVELANVEEYAFEGCTNLSDVYYNGTPEQKEEIEVDEGNDELLDARWHYGTEEITGVVEWNAEDVQFKGTTAYVIANGSAQTPRFTVKNSADGSVIDPEFYDYEYKENTNAGTGYVIVTFKGAYEGTCRGVFKIYLPATETTTVDNVADGIKLTWSAVPGADGYVIYRRAWSSTTDGWTDFVRWNNTTALEWLDTAVYAGTRYQYGIKAYFNKRVDPVTGAQIGGNVGDNFNLGEVGPLKTTVRITTRTLSSVTSGNKRMTVKWEGSKNFTGYQIKYATDANFTKNVKAIKITDAATYSKVITELTNGTTYYVTVRSYHEFNGMTYFGEWSNVLSVKVGKPTITTQPKNQTVATGKTATFKVVASGDSLTYQWYYSKNNGSTWTKWSGKTAASLSFKGSATNNGYMYRCKVTSSYGYVYTNAAKLTVE